MQESRRSFFTAHLKLVVISAILITALASVIITVLVIQNLHPNSKTHSSSNAPDNSGAFPIYYPSDLPGGFTFDRSSVNKQNKVVIYVINYSANKRISVAVQPRPSQDVIDKFNDNALAFSSPAESSIGNATIGNARGITTASIVAPKSWVIMTAPDGIDIDEFKAVIQSIRITSPAG